MSEFDELKSKINHLEYDEIKPLKEDISDIKIKMNTNDLLTKQALECNEKLSGAIDILKNTMMEVSQSVKDSNRINTEITKTIEELDINGVDIVARMPEVIMLDLPIKIGDTVVCSTPHAVDKLSP